MLQRAEPLEKSKGNMKSDIARLPHNLYNKKGALKE
jgi:hypothetical protein